MRRPSQPASEATSTLICSEKTKILELTLLYSPAEVTSLELAVWRDGSAVSGLGGSAAQLMRK